jgi:predicted HTH transcriptional regulator
MADSIFVSSVQVMLFSDRLEVWNPGTLPPTLTLEKLREPHGSYPANPLVAEPLYLAGYIERMGTGTGDMIRRCREVGLAEPEFTLDDGFMLTIRRKPESAFEAVGGLTGEVAGEVTGEVAGEVGKLLLVCEGAMSRRQLQDALSLKGEENFRNLYLIPALELGLVEMTIPDKPTSRLQKYRLTEKGRAWVAELARK